MSGKMLLISKSLPSLCSFYLTVNYLNLHIIYLFTSGLNPLYGSHSQGKKQGCFLPLGIHRRREKISQTPEYPEILCPVVIMMRLPDHCFLLMLFAFPAALATKLGSIKQAVMTHPYLSLPPKQHSSWLTTLTAGMPFLSLTWVGLFQVQLYCYQTSSFSISPWPVSSSWFQHWICAA